MTSSTILVLNCGSSSIKFAVIDALTQSVHINGLVERLNASGTVLRWTIQDTRQHLDLPHASYETAMDAIIKLLHDAGLFNNIIAVGHRVVHGGEQFKQSTLINDTVLQNIEKCVHLAPLHNPSNYLGIKLMQQHFHDKPQAAVFDTSFHQTMPSHAYHYAIPEYFYTQHGVRRYGFHGISYRYVMQHTLELLNLPENNHALIIAHLGNGCSACAILNGASQDTTMGMTPLEGLIMGTRAGDIDPGIIGYIASELNLTLDQIIEILNKKSGLLGISDLSMDMRTLEQQAAQNHAGAKLAIDMFCYRLAKNIAALSTALPHVDALIFTGGIGENSSLVRQKTIERLRQFNLIIDAALNIEHGKKSKGIITTPESKIAMVVPTNEELLIAQDTYQLLNIK